MGFIVGAALVLGFLGLAGAAASLFAIGWGVRRGYYALSGKKYVPLLQAGGEPQYEHQDINDGATAESLTTIFRRSISAKGVAPYARAGMASLGDLERKTAAFHGVLDSKFEPGSITWQKFASAADVTREGVLRNCADLANAIQVFDSEDFKRAERERRAATYRGDSKANESMQIEKRHHFDTQLADMRAICERNDRLLLELDKLTTELNTLDDTGSSAASDRLIEEIRTLTAETKYYRDALDNMDQQAQ